MTVRILERALQDLEAAREFYDLQGDGLGAYFLDSLFSEIDSLALFAGIHRKVFGSHRMLARRFPYAIYYRMNEPETAVVWRVLDLRQHPARIRRALE